MLHTGEHIDPQNMFNMGGLRKKMPLTFWTFLIGGFALSGFPLVTAGFWSKDMILAEAFGTSSWGVLIALSLAALLTAFYTMRQITLTFLGEPRTKAAHHAVESKWTMTAPLVVLAIFSIALGWAGIEEGFPILGGLLPNWVHDFVGETLLEHPETLAFSFIPLAISLTVALGGLALGWLVYRNLRAGAADPLEKPLGFVYRIFKNKYYFDEFYDWAFVRPSYWIAETFVSLWTDRKVIDGFLHWVAHVTSIIGVFFRTYIDKLIVNGFGDLVGESVKRIGRSSRVIQTGRIQQYMVSALVTVAVISAVFYYLVVLAP